MDLSNKAIEKMYKFVSTTFTLVIFLGVIGFVSNGEVFQDIAQYKHDLALFTIILSVGILLAVVISKLTVRNEKVLIRFILLFVYYYLALVFFGDGHFAGWSHSISLSDKLLMASIHAFIVLTSIIIPIGMMLLAIIHILILQLFAKKWNSNQAANKRIE